MASDNKRIVYFERRIIYRVAAVRSPRYAFSSRHVERFTNDKYDSGVDIVIKSTYPSIIVRNEISDEQYARRGRYPLLVWNERRNDVHVLRARVQFKRSRSVPPPQSFSARPSGTGTTRAPTEFPVRRWFTRERITILVPKNRHRGIIQPRNPRERERQGE